MARTILELPIDQIVPDEDQVRRYLDDGAGLRPLRDAIERWGQLHPIRVRAEGGKFIIVDGERRWRAIRQLRDKARKKRSGETRFDHIQAIVATGADDDEEARKAIQFCANMGANLLPFEKARVVAHLRETARASGQGLRNEEVAKMLGISKGQVGHLIQLSQAPDFILELGKPRTYDVVQKDRTDPNGKPIVEREERDALTTPFLRQLFITFKKLTEEDKQLLERNLDHKPRAATAVRQLGTAAQRDHWTFQQLKQRSDRLVSKQPVHSKTSAVLEQLILVGRKVLDTDPSSLEGERRAEATQTLQHLVRHLAEVE